METKETYNGWTNYETWRIALEMFDGYGDNIEKGEFNDIYELEERLKDEVYEFINGETGGNNIFVTGWANAFCENVNYLEIARNINADYELGLTDGLEK